ncbi:hypothetical protein HS7_20650 [Sulfolobales archaeon HS-7]|nr:hypothetical protein HS7_20650 [Sulfolobales archaeon HS-7]
MKHEEREGVKGREPLILFNEILKEVIYAKRRRRHTALPDEDGWGQGRAYDSTFENYGFLLGES